MGSDFVVGDKVRILKNNLFAGKTGVIIKDGGSQNLGTRKLGESEYNTWLKQWVVKIDNTGEEAPFLKESLEKIT